VLRPDPIIALVHQLLREALHQREPRLAALDLARAVGHAAVHLVPLPFVVRFLSSLPAIMTTTTTTTNPQTQTHHQNQPQNQTLNLNLVIRNPP
jgi:hypothetical protein